MFMCLHASGLTLIATLLLGIELLPMPVINPVMHVALRRHSNDALNCSNRQPAMPGISQPLI
jgi:hypothetical protein